MKKLILVLALLFSSGIFAQQTNSKNDIIVTADGKFLQVKVTKVSDGVVTFSYPGETLVNEIKPSAIDKIVFASGRTQEFDGTSSSGEMQEMEVPGKPMKEVPKKPDYEKNTMAVVPLEFEKNGNYEKNLAGKATDYMMELIRKHADSQTIKVLPMDKAIEKLLDANINYSELRKSSPEKLRKVFETEYILYVSINEKQKDTTVNVGESDYISGSSNSESLNEVARNVKLSMYAAKEERKTFGLDFSEVVSMSKATQNSRLKFGEAWKSSLDYLVGQLYASPVFSGL